MRIIRRYLWQEIVRGVGLVLLGFLGITAFNDLINELDELGQGSYRLPQALLYVLLSVPANVYQLMPVAALIGCIFALAQFASSSEFTAMRAAGMGRAQALRSVLGIGVVLAVLATAAGEWVAPIARQSAQDLRVRSLGLVTPGAFRSGFWIRDSQRDPQTGAMESLRMVNVGSFAPDGTLRGLEIYDLNRDFRLNAVTRAGQADYVGPLAQRTGPPSGVHAWRLHDIERTHYRIEALPDGTESLSTRIERLETEPWNSDLSPRILDVLAIDPDVMSATGLWRYVRYLEANGQNANRYALAMWKKIVYPVAILVMLALALPFGYLQTRSGGVGMKLFVGIMLGVVFFFMNSLFNNLGLLNTWPPWVAVSIPSAVALAVALAMLARVGRT